MADGFKAARDFLLAHRTAYRTAYRDFRWPELDRFNWALDWFDRELAQGDNGNRPALRIIGDGAASLTFAELSQRSNRVANGLRALGVGRRDCILLMLGNIVPLWEMMLAAMKLGAVIIPATTLLTRADLRDRFARGRVRHLVTTAGDAVKFDGLDPGVTRIAVGNAPADWHRYRVGSSADRANARLSAGGCELCAARSHSLSHRTGDVAMRDPDGCLTFVGRADDVFKASDYRVSPFELESALIEHAAVAEAAVVPAPDPTRTAMPKAYVSLAAGILADRDTALSIFRHVRDRRALQAGAADRVLRFAEDDLRQDPPRRAAGGRVGASEKR
jgi:acyl-coenzyme A synthetase/AMP-(fatty) acid ligase